MIDDFDVEIQADEYSDYFDQLEDYYEDYLEWTNRFGDALDCKE